MCFQGRVGVGGISIHILFLRKLRLTHSFAESYASRLGKIQAHAVVKNDVAAVLVTSQL
jgi:acyl-coenzyme A thioesterase PaaI-like protein